MIPPGEERKAKAESATATKFSRKAFTWTGPSNKMDYCWYRQEWRNVGISFAKALLQGFAK